MENREIPWAEHEKVYLLAEMIKAAQVPSHVLFNFVRDAQIQPRWNDMALPPGRSLRSSQVAYESLAGNYTQYPRPPIPAAGPHPIMYTGPESSKKRSFQESAAPMGRLIQPRPPPNFPGDYIQAGPAYPAAMNPTGEPANKKKRGRPTKAEAQQKAQEAAARGEIYPPPRRGRVSITAPPEPSPLGSELRPLERTPPQSAPGPMTSAMTPQHQMQPEEEGQESSSGKRRRTRPQPLELDMPPRPLSEMESPLAYGTGDPHRNPTFASYTPISAPLPSSGELRDRDTRMEGVEETTQPRTTTPHSFKDTVGI